MLSTEERNCGPITVAETLFCRRNARTGANDQSLYATNSNVVDAFPTKMRTEADSRLGGLQQPLLPSFICVAKPLQPMPTGCRFVQYIRFDTKSPRAVFLADGMFVQTGGLRRMRKCRPPSIHRSSRANCKQQFQKTAANLFSAETETDSVF